MANDTIPSERWMPSTSDGAGSVFLEDEISRFSRSLLTFAGIMTVIIMIVGIFGNLLTILALVKCPKVRNVAAAFIISLCLADCLFCAIVLPFSAFRFIQGTWTHGNFLCRIIPFIQYGNIGVSLLCIAMITINRYIMIAHHNGYAKIYKRHWIGAMIAFCWIFAYGMQIPTLLGVWGTFGYDSKLGTCSIMSDEKGKSSKTALFVIAFVIPCLIIIGCYAKIFWVVHRSEVRLRQHANNQNSVPNNLRQMPSSTGSNGASKMVSSPVSSSSLSTSSGAEVNKYGTSQKTIRVKDQRDIKAKRNEWRITKMVLAIFLSFVVCYLPITVVKVADQDVYSPGWHIFGYIMLYMSACINPIIYVIMNKQYRKAYKTVLMCQPSRFLPFAKADSSAGEKWKDIGCSYNHSRTIVSQVSVADQQMSSYSYNSNQSPVALELSPQTLLSQPNLMQTSTTEYPPVGHQMANTNKSSDLISHNTKTIVLANSPNPLTKDAMMTPNNNNHQSNNQNNSPSLPLQHVSLKKPEPQQLSFNRQEGTPCRGPQITLEEEHIIMQEEGDTNIEGEQKDQISLVISPTNPFKVDYKEISKVQKDPQYKEGYKQNINVIPDSNTKITSKPNMLGELMEE